MDFDTHVVRLFGILGLLFACASHAAGDRAPKSDVEIFVVPNHYACGNSAATLARNNNEASRVYATIQLPIYPVDTIVPNSITTLDRFFKPRKQILSTSFKELFFPGETKFIACAANPDWRVIGGYYPNSDMSLPQEASPADMLVVIKENTTTGNCAIPMPANHAYLHVQNIHPRYTLSFNFKNTTTGGKRSGRMALVPYEKLPIGCENEQDNISFSDFEYSKQ